jgi:hypothetical protein
VSAGEGEPRERLCPSAQPTAPGAVALGVVDHTGTAPEVAYLDEPVPVSESLLALAEPLRPTELFRFAARCERSACRHWTGATCSLAARIVEQLPVASSELPRCTVRADCRWFAEQGRTACLRCPQIVTQNEAPTAAMRDAAAPPK